MRITCPNCGAQYEVPDQVIPAEGRDVQCSNCGNTWFQTHPDQAVVEDDDQELIAEPEATPEPEPEPEPVEEDSNDDDSDAAPEAPPRTRDLDPEVAGILREEAELETRLREAEAATGLESQTELGLEDYGDDEATRRAREARERMARMRGETLDDDFEPTDDSEADLSPRPRSRLLPDVDDINTSIRNEQPAAVVPAEAEMAVADELPRKSGGFGRGFGLVLLLGVLLILLYANTDKVTDTVPAIAGPVDGFVAQIDKLRVWLDSQLSGFIPQ